MRPDTKKKAEAHRRLRESCKNYRSQPIHEMNIYETIELAKRQALDARSTLRIMNPDGSIRKMDSEECEMYAGIIADSILFFNKRSENHKKAILYREECRKKQQEYQQRCEMLRNKKESNIVIHIV